MRGDPCPGNGPHGNGPHAAALPSLLAMIVLTSTPTVPDDLPGFHYDRLGYSYFSQRDVIDLVRQVVRFTDSPTSLIILP
jgi:hypothetical protein